MYEILYENGKIYFAAFNFYVIMGYLSAKVFVGNSILHLLKKSRRSVLCKEYFSSKYNFITMNR